MAMIVAAILFAVYLANVVLGATMQSAFMTDVQEMLTLFAATIAFVVVILQREAAEEDAKDTE